MNFLLQILVVLVGIEVVVVITYLLNFHMYILIQRRQLYTRHRGLQVTQMRTGLLFLALPYQIHRQE